MRVGLRWLVHAHAHFLLLVSPLVDFLKAFAFLFEQRLLLPYLSLLLLELLLGLFFLPSVDPLLDHVDPVADEGMHLLQVKDLHELRRESEIRGLCP